MTDFLDLDDHTRKLMLSELDSDLSIGRLHVSRRLSPEGQRRYPDLLKTAMESGDDAELAEILRVLNLMNTFEKSPRGGTKRVPKNAETLAEGEFGRYYV